MLDFLFGDGFPHLLAAVVLLSRVADIVSTRLASPRLALEANPIARRFGWPFIYATLLVALLPYWNAGLGIAAATMSFLVAASNFSVGWVARGLGEDAHLRTMVGAVRKVGLPVALLHVWLGAACLILPAAMLYWLCLPDSAPGVWFALALGTYGLARGIFGSTGLLRLRRLAAGATPLAMAAAEPAAGAFHG